MSIVTNWSGRLVSSALLLVVSTSCLAQETTTTSSGSFVDPVATSHAANTASELTAPGVGDVLHRDLQSTSTDKSGTSSRVNVRSAEPIVLATWNGGEMTNHELSATLQLRRPREIADMQPDDVLRLPAPRLRNVVEDLVYEELLYKKAVAMGINEETTGIKKRLDDYQTLVLGRIFFDQEIKPRLQKMDEASARQYYESRRERLFTAPERMTVKEIFLPNYSHYTAKEGDTLEKIATTVSGNQDAADRILRDDPLHYPRKTAEGKEHPPVIPVKPGEKLLVPLTADELTSTERIGQQMLERLKRGEAFDEVAAKNSYVNPAPYPPLLKEIMPHLADAILKTEESSVTELLTSKHGFHIFQVHDRQPTRTLSFEEVKETILGTLEEDEKTRSVEKVKQQLFDQLQEKHNVVINHEALKRSDYAGADPLTGSTPIISAPDFTLTLNEFLQAMHPTMKSWSGMTYEERLSLAKASPSLIGYLVRRESLEMGIDKTETYLREMESKRIIEVTSEYRRRQQEKNTGPSEEDLRAFYKSNIDRYTKPAEVDVREITKRINMTIPLDKRAEAIEAAKVELEKLRTQIKSKEEFADMARRESEAIATRSRGGLIEKVKVDFRGPVVKNQLDQLKPGEITEPFMYGSEVMIMMLDSLRPPVVAAYEEVASRVRIDYLREVQPEKQEQEKEETLKAAGFELKF